MVTGPFIISYIVIFISTVTNWLSSWNLNVIAKIIDTNRDYSRHRPSYWRRLSSTSWQVLIPHHTLLTMVTQTTNWMNHETRNSSCMMTFVHSFKIGPNSNNNRSIIIFIVHPYAYIHENTTSTYIPCINNNNNKINNKSTLSIFGLALISVERWCIQWCRYKRAH